MKIQSEKGFVMTTLLKIILIGILVVAIPVSVKLVQEQQILKSRAAGICEDQFGTHEDNSIWDGDCVDTLGHRGRYQCIDGVIRSTVIDDDACRGSAGSNPVPCSDGSGTEVCPGALYYDSRGNACYNGTGACGGDGGGQVSCSDGSGTEVCPGTLYFDSQGNRCYNGTGACPYTPCSDGSGTEVCSGTLYYDGRGNKCYNGTGACGDSGGQKPPTGGTSTQPSSDEAPSQPESNYCEDEGFFACTVGVPNGSCPGGTNWTKYECNFGGKTYCSNNCVKSGVTPPADNVGVGTPDAPSAPSGGTQSSACKIPMASFTGNSTCTMVPNNSYKWVIIQPGTGGAPGIDAARFGANNACGGASDAAAHAVCPQNTSDPLNVRASTSMWCYEFNEGNRCIQLRHEGTGGGGGGVGGDTGTCNIDGQSPDLGPTCAACLDSKVPAVVSNIKNMNPTDFNGCSDQKIFNKWCNGFGSEAKGQCDALKAGACATSCGGTPPKADSQVCAQVITPAKNRATGECKDFATPCAVPEGWDKVASCTAQTTSPVGYFDTASCTGFTGWARDADSVSTGLKIDFWLEKNSGNNADLTANQYLGFVIANQSRADLPFADKNHSFSFDPKTIIPSDKWPLFFAGKARDISAFAINVDSSGVRQDRLAAGGSLLHTQLPSNKTVTCQADKPPYRIEFRVSENPNFAGAQWEVYQGAVMTRNFTFQDRKPGLKTVFVEFKDSLGKTEKDSAQIELVAPPSPTPVPSPTVIPSTSPTPPPPPVVTTHFRIAETPADLSGAEWQPYTTVPVKIDNFEFKDKTSGQKFIWAEFKDSKGKKERRSQAIRLLGDDPVITSCSLGFEDNNTTLRIKGKNFGSAKGTVKSGNSTLQIKGSWKDDSVEASLPDAKAGQIIPVSLISTDSQSVDGSCGSISALALGAKVFCKQPFSHQTDDVALTLAGAFEGGTKVKQQVSIDKDGVIKGLTAKLEEGKSYILSLKAPRSIRKTSKVFTAGKGVTNVPNFILWVGDIFPVDGGDGIINGADKTELNRQWSSVSDAKGRSGDFNQDSRVNSLDWACMSFSMVDAQGRSDDKEPEPGVQSSPAPSPSPSLSPSVSPSPSASPGT